MARNGVRVRAAVHGDLDGLVRLTDEVRESDLVRGRAGRAPRSPEARDRFGRLLADDRRHVLVAVAEPGEDEDVVGMAVCQVEDASPVTDVTVLYVSHLVVAPRHRRRGTGHALVAAVAALAEAERIEQIVVGVAVPGREANRFFARLGFAPMITRRIAPVAAVRRALARSDRGRLELGRSEPAGVERSHGMRGGRALTGLGRSRIRRSG